MESADFSKNDYSKMTELEYVALTDPEEKAVAFKQMLNVRKEKFAS
jgi:hypothetical protein